MSLTNLFISLLTNLILKPQTTKILDWLSIYYAWKNIKSEYNNNKFKISAPTWNDEFDLPDGSYSIADIQDYFEFIIKKHETLAENPPIQIYPNKIKNRMVRIVFKRKTGYKLELREHQCPEIVPNYNLHMGSVDLSEHLMCYVFRRA